MLLVLGFSASSLTLADDEWTSSTQTPTAREKLGACVVDDTIHAIGGMRFTATSCSEGEVNIEIDQNGPPKDRLNVSIPVVRLSPDVLCQELSAQ